jgi:hypothetical protein
MLSAFIPNPSPTQWTRGNTCMLSPPASFPLCGDAIRSVVDARYKARLLTLGQPRCRSNKQRGCVAIALIGELPVGKQVVVHRHAAGISDARGMSRVGSQHTLNALTTPSNLLTQRRGFCPCIQQPRFFYLFGTKVAVGGNRVPWAL